MTRTIPGLLLAGVWLLLLLKGGYLLFWMVAVGIGLAGAREYLRMVFPVQLFEVDRVVLMVVIALPIICSAGSENGGCGVYLGALLAFLGLVLFTMIRYGWLEQPLMILSQGTLGIVFIGLLGAHLVLIRGLPDGAHWLVILSAVTAGSDSFAYWVGSRLGKRKLCPRISPNKTIEGGIGGVIGGIGAAALLYLFLEVQATLFGVILISLLLSVIGMIGDLLESVIKRGTGTKDSGWLLAGHGGVLDRVDSLLLSGPFLYYLLTYSGLG